MTRACPGRRAAAMPGAAPQPRLRRRIACVALAMSVLAAGIIAASERSQAITPATAKKYLDAMALTIVLRHVPPLGGEELSASQAAASVARYATFHLLNVGATTEPGEPRFNGRMNRTLWGKLKLGQNSRVVIHTFGSVFDTALAVHTGNKVNKLKKVVFNDNYKVPGLESHTLPGLSNKQSLVQFDAEKGTDYSVQFGSKTGDEGFMSASVFVFPKSGGLSAFLAEANGNSLWGGREFNCGFGTTEPISCDDATFLLHNSTNKTLTVIASSDLGPGVTAPGPITLKAGKAALATFTFAAGFDKTTARTVAGQFEFVGKRAGKVISRAATRAVIVVKSGVENPNVLKATKITPTVQSNWINAGNEFKVTLKNTGAFTAKGCHARTQRFEYLRVIWQRLKSGKPAGSPNTPFNIAAGESKTFLLTAGSMEYRGADPEFPAHVVIDCANTAAAPLNLKNSFDFSAVSNWKTADLVTKILSPKGDILKVPSSGQKSFKVSAKSTGKNGTIRVFAAYRYPSGETDLYPVSVCQLKKKNGGCKASPTSSVEYDTEKGVTTYFKVVVEAPASDPGFDATKRRVFLNFWHKRPAAFAGDGFSAIPVAAESIAPKLF